MEAIMNNFINAVGWSIFHSLWQGAIIYGLLLLLVFTFPKVSAKTKHNFAYGSLCCILIGFCITFATIFKLPTPVRAFGGAEVAEYSHMPLPAISQILNSRTEHYFPVLVGTYGIGLILQIIVLLASYGKLMQLKKATRLEAPSDWQLMFIELTRKLGLRIRISFHLSDKVNVPLVIGYLKPVVLFPVALATQLDLKQVEAILIHELSHIRRNDYLLNLIKTSIETLLFFNPFVWLSSRFIAIEREHACDDLVIQLTGTPVTYAHALLKLEILKDKTTPALSMAAVGKNQHLYQRIKRITNMKTNYTNAKQKILAFAVTLATIVSLAWINPSQRNVTTKLTNPGDRSIEIAETSIKSKLLQNQLPIDTSKKKKVVKIITVDAKGNKREYNSVKEMPDSIKNEVINETFSYNGDFLFGHDLDSIALKSMEFVKSPEFKAHLDEVKANAEKIAKMHNSPEFKAQIELIKQNSEKIAKQFESPEFKKHLKEIEQNAAKIKERFNSPEWKKQQDEIIKNAEKIRQKYDSPEWRKEVEELEKLHNSTEYKQLKQKFNKDLEKLKEKKSIKSDINSHSMLDSDRVSMVVNYQNL